MTSNLTVDMSVAISLLFLAIGIGYLFGFYLIETELLDYLDSGWDYSYEFNPSMFESMDIIGVPAAKQEIPMAYDSSDLLIQELDAFGISFSGLASNMNVGVIHIINDVSLSSTDVDVSEFSDACNPESARVYPIFMVETPAAQKEIVEFVEANTQILVEDIEEGDWLDKLLADVVLPDPFDEVGSDEAMFLN